MDQAGRKEDRQTSFGLYTAPYGCNCLISILNQLHRTSLPSTKFRQTLPCPSTVQLFLWKALTGGLLTFDYLNIYPRCNFDLKTAIHFQSHYCVSIGSWITRSIVTDESLGIAYPSVIAL